MRRCDDGPGGAAGQEGRGAIPRRPLANWQKIRAEKIDDFVIVGFTSAQGMRAGFGALHMAAYAADTLVYCGRAGSGFTEEQLVGLRAALEEDRRQAPACTGPTPAGAHVWVEPRHVAEVRYLAWTGEGMLRQPVFLRLRDDKPPEDCRLPARRSGEDADAAALAGEAAAGGLGLSALMTEAPVEKKVPFSNLTKIFWPEEGHTKGDLIDYYRAIYPWLGLYLADRPLVLTRYPDGIHGKSFFQKDAPQLRPGVGAHSSGCGARTRGREIDYFVCGRRRDAPLHHQPRGRFPSTSGRSRIRPWPGRTGSSWISIRRTAPFDHVVQLARAVQAPVRGDRRCRASSRPPAPPVFTCWCPSGGQCTFDQCKTLAELLARVVASRCPTSPPRSTSGDRGGHVYLDFLQNGHGKLLAAPFTARPVPGALASAPLVWDEVGDDLDLKDYTIETLPGRMEALGEDPLARVLTARPDLMTALGRLAGLLEG